MLGHQVRRVDDTRDLDNFKCAISDQLLHPKEPGIKMAHFSYARAFADANCRAGVHMDPQRAIPAKILHKASSCESFRRAFYSGDQLCLRA